MRKRSGGGAKEPIEKISARMIRSQRCSLISHDYLVPRFGLYMQANAESLIPNDLNFLNVLNGLNRLIAPLTAFFPSGVFSGSVQRPERG